MQLKYRIGSAVASAALFATVFAPAASAANVNISGNGAFSVNGVNYTSNMTKIVSQSNTTVATNLIGSNANSGNNSSSFNTGGTANVVSGPASSNVQVGVAGGNNTLMSAGCGCLAAPNVNIAGNGAFSFNTANLVQNHVTSMTQTNATVATNAIGSNANSGNNSSMFNTGGGSTVATSPATSNLTTVTTGGSNTITATP